MESMFLLAEGGTIAEWTSLGVLVLVLGAVGRFLAVYLPNRESAFLDGIKAAREDAREERERAERVINNLVNGFEAANEKTSQAIAKVSEALQDLSAEFRSFRERGETQ